MKSTKETLEKRIETLNRINGHLADASVVLQDETDNLTKGEVKRLTLNINKLMEFIDEETASAMKQTEKASAPSMSAKLKALKEKFSEEEIDELLREKGIEL